MNELTTIKDHIPPMCQEAIGKVYELEKITAKMPQSPIPITHTLHGGVYSRTLMLPAGVLITGALIKVATTLIVSGRVKVYIGDKATEVSGYHPLTASANRKQAFFALEDTHMTMLFATTAKSVEEAEEEFTGEAHLLSSRSPSAVNHISITGE